MPNDEKELFIQSFKKGEEPAFDKLFHTYAPVLSLLAYSFIHEEQKAERIAHESFINLWKNRKKLNSILAIKNYLYTFILSHCIDVPENNIDRHTTNTDHPNRAVSGRMAINSAIIRIETAKEIYNAIELLPHKMQQLVSLYYLEEKASYEAGRLVPSDPAIDPLQRFKALQFFQKTIIPGWKTFP